MTGSIESDYSIGNHGKTDWFQSATIKVPWFRPNAPWLERFHPDRKKAGFVLQPLTMAILFVLLTAVFTAVGLILTHWLIPAL